MTSPPVPAWRRVVPDVGALLGDDEVAHERRHESAEDDVSLDAGDGRLLQIADPEVRFEVVLVLEVQPTFDDVPREFVLLAGRSHGA